MKTISAISCLTLTTLLTLASPKTDAAEEDITVLLNCAVIIATTEGNITRYDDYVVAASYLAVDNGKSMEWLNGEIERAFEAADDFSEESDAAIKCVQTLSKFKEDGDG